VTYLAVKNQFLGILNRRDITPSLTDTFMLYGIQRIQREVRCREMEKLTSVLTDGSSTIDIPTDLLEVISLNTNDQVNVHKLVRTDLQTILNYSKIPGQPRFYYRQDGKFSIGPYPPEDTTIWINYYCDVSSLTADTDSNWLTEQAPALLVYAALAYAADYFLDDRKQLFESSYAQVGEQLMLQSTQEDLENASISPAYDTAPNYVGPYYGL
jgi:hypothetical protein